VPRSPDLISVIIPAYNVGARLGAQLDALGTQTYHGPVEIIVADNGSADDSIELARAWRDARIRLRVVDASLKRGPGAARNVGARVAAGDFLAFCDADDVADPGWLEKLVETAATADLVGGRLDAARLNSRAAQECYTLTEPDVPHLGFLATAAGANLGVWADVFAQLGGFDEASRTGEDVAFCWHAQLRGYTFAPSPALMHKRLPRNALDVARRFFRYGVGDAWLYRQFAAAGMPRRTRRSTLVILQLLARGWPGEPAPLRRCHWLLVSALTCGRLAGSARYRVLFT
jgi:glycosyltransferase involved in cell wall biosynthesis